MTIVEAEARIATILRDLEEETGNLVETVDIHDIEATKISDTRKQFLKHVKITMTRRPGHSWGQARQQENER